MNKLIFIIIFFIVSCSIPRSSTIGIQEIKLHEWKNMHFIDITLNGKDSKLLIDTGASKSLLDISKAEEYQFSYVLLSNNQYVGLGGLESIYAPYDYKIEDFIISFLGADLSEIQHYFNRDGVYIVGILGSDYLEKNDCRIDFKKNILYIKY